MVTVRPGGVPTARADGHGGAPRRYDRPMVDRDSAAQTAGTDTLGVHNPLNARLASLLVDAVEEYAIFALDPDGIITTWNRGARRIKGYSADEIVGRHFGVFYTDDDLRAGKPERQLAQAREQGHSHDEGWRVRRDGSRFWANVTITAIVGSDGHLNGFAKVTRDDTDRKRIEEQVRELELLSDRERIAHEMHETVVQRIFEATTALAGALTLSHDASVTRRLHAALQTLDATVREIRGIVLDPQPPDPDAST